MLNRIELTPGSDNESLVNAINDNFRQIENENRTKIIKDETGKRRIIIGRDPKGKYVIAISKPGFDAIEELMK